jgi:hypothetical protein
LCSLLVRAERAFFPDAVECGSLSSRRLRFTTSERPKRKKGYFPAPSLPKKNSTREWLFVFGEPAMLCAVECWLMMLALTLKTKFLIFAKVLSSDTEYLLRVKKPVFSFQLAIKSLENPGFSGMLQCFGFGFTLHYWFRSNCDKIF